MSFFLAGRLNCFICTCVIDTRVEAARLFYAHPDDVGDIARYGRNWVHRQCWHEWPLREAWARSAVRLLTNQEGAETVSNELVVCRLGEHDILLQDTWLAIEVSIPRSQVEDVLAALEATTTSRVTWKGVRWTFTPDAHGLVVTVEDEMERFEAFALEPGTWRIPLEQAQRLRGEA
jgi:hypothetical protein